MQRWVTFDTYGTLIDWERGLDTLARLWPDADRAVLLARYHEIEPKVESERPTATYREVMADTLARLADAEGLKLADADRDALGASLPSWPAFPEVPGALRELRSRGWRIALLSNTDPDLLRASVRHLGLEPDLMVTAAEAASYKPALGHWSRFAQLSGAEPRGHVHVAASTFHDIAPAHELGITAVWINRRGETSDVPRAAELPDLSRLPDVLDALVPSRAPMDKARISEGVRMILEGIGEDPTRAGIAATPDRVADMYEEIFAGIGVDAQPLLSVVAGAGHDEIIMVRDIPLYSVCEHHLLPFVGRAHVAYLPNRDGRITGLSKIARVVDVLAKRLQVQERLTTEIADALDEALEPRGVFVMIEAEHLCMTMRGVEKPGSMTVTSAVRGGFRTDARTRMEALELLRRGRT
jgi:GTP cyclohydrolase I